MKEAATAAAMMKTCRQKDEEQSVAGRTMFNGKAINKTNFEGPTRD